MNTSARCELVVKHPVHRILGQRFSGQRFGKVSKGRAVAKNLVPLVLPILDDPIGVLEQLDSVRASGGHPVGKNLQACRVTILAELA